MLENYVGLVGYKLQSLKLRFRRVRKANISFINSKVSKTIAWKINIVDFHEIYLLVSK